MPNDDKRSAGKGHNNSEVPETSSVQARVDEQGAFLEKPASTVPKRIGRFEVRALLGAGAFGAVYRAHDPKLDREVALKVPKLGTLVNDQQRARFFREARSAAALKHPNICAVYEVHDEGDVPFIVMDFISGTTLADYLKQRTRPLPARQAAMITLKLAQGLEHAHAKQVVHRDLKPGNIMIDLTRKSIVITDFGLARRMTPEEPGLTTAGAILGTPWYMSPEQARGDSHSATPASDIFSLGVILYELLTGELPFRGKMTEVLDKVQTVEPPPPSKKRAGIDARLEAICLKALAKKPAQRFATMGDFARALIEYMKETPNPASVSTTKGETGSPYADVLAALSAENNEAARAQRGLAATILVGLGCFGVSVVIAGAFLAFAIWFSRGDSNPPQTVTVTLQNITYINDITVDYYLDGQKTESKKLKGPIKLTVGEHELEAKRILELLEVYKFKVGLQDDQKAVALEKPPPLAKQVPKKTPLIANDDRLAAEWILSKGGEVSVQANMEKLVTVMPGEPLPIGAIHLVKVILKGTKISDNVLVGLKGCTNLTEIHLASTNVTDAGLANLKSCRSLVLLNITKTKTSDAGMAFFRDFENLDTLAIGYTAVTDAGLANFKSCRKLKNLQFEHTRIGDVGVAHFEDCSELLRLELTRTKVTDVGLAHFKNCTKLKRLMLEETSVTDTGLANFKDCNNLEYLLLGQTAVTDAGLSHFERCRALMSLTLHETKISDAGIRSFNECKRLVSVRLDNTSVGDAGLAHLKECRSIKQLYLENTKISDAGLFSVKTMPKLEAIKLNGTTVTDVGLEHLGACVALRGLQLDSTAVSDAGLLHLRPCKNLQGIFLTDTKVTNAAVPILAAFSNLEMLTLAGTAVDEAGVSQLATFKNLRDLDLRRLRVGPAAVAALQKSLPNCKILWDAPKTP